MLDIGNTLDNFSTLIGINTEILPSIITLLVIIVLLILTFKMQVNGLLSVGIVIALYTLAMGLLTALNIESYLNIFSLLEGTDLGMVVLYGH